MLVSSEDARYAEALEKFVEYIRRVTSAIPVWKSIAELPEGLPLNKIKDFRQQGLVCLSATGLVVIGRVGHEMFKNEVSNWRSYADRLGQIDWDRTAPIWQGSIIQSGKLMTQQTPVREAVLRVRAAIGLTDTAAKAA